MNFIRNYFPESSTVDSIGFNFRLIFERKSILEKNSQGICEGVAEPIEGAASVRPERQIGQELCRLSQFLIHGG